MPVKIFTFHTMENAGGGAWWLQCPLLRELSATLETNFSVVENYSTLLIVAAYLLKMGHPWWSWGHDSVTWCREFPENLRIRSSTACSSYWTMLFKYYHQSLISKFNSSLTQTSRFTEYIEYVGYSRYGITLCRPIVKQTDSAGHL